MAGPRSGWRWLAAFWVVVVLVLGGGAAALQALGPPTRPSPAPSAPAAPAPRDAPAVTGPVAAPQPASVEPARPATPRGIAPPDPALLERSPTMQGAQLPKVAADGRRASSVYAAPSPTVPAGTPRIALLLSGFGLSEKDSRAAIDSLPPAVAFATSAYAGVPPSVFDAARTAGHELFSSLPMEPQGFPLNDAGARSMLTGLSPEENRQMLDFALSRVPGAVGATGASDGMRGERFADMSGALDPVLEEVGRRGLLYLDPRPGRAPQRPGVPARAVDLVLDDPPARAEIEAKLAALERIAREKGTAIGLAGPLRPVTIERIAAWAQGLQQRGIALVPVSALVTR